MEKLIEQYRWVGLFFVFFRKMRSSLERLLISGYLIRLKDVLLTLFFMELLMSLLFWCWLILFILRYLKWFWRDFRDDFLFFSLFFCILVGMCRQIFFEKWYMNGLGRNINLLRFQNYVQGYGCRVEFQGGLVVFLGLMFIFINLVC